MESRIGNGNFFLKKGGKATAKLDAKTGQIVSQFSKIVGALNQTLLSPLGGTRQDEAEQAPGLIADGVPPLAPGKNPYPHHSLKPRGKKTTCPLARQHRETQKKTNNAFVALLMQKMYLKNNNASVS